MESVAFLQRYLGPLVKENREQLELYAQFGDSLEPSSLTFEQQEWYCLLGDGLVSTAQRLASLVKELGLSS